MSRITHILTSLITRLINLITMRNSRSAHLSTLVINILSALSSLRAHRIIAGIIVRYRCYSFVSIASPNLPVCCHSQYPAANISPHASETLPCRVLSTPHTPLITSRIKSIMAPPILDTPQLNTRDRQPNMLKFRHLIYMVDRRVDRVFNRLGVVLRYMYVNLSNGSRRRTRIHLIPDYPDIIKPWSRIADLGILHLLCDVPHVSHDLPLPLTLDCL